MIYKNQKSALIFKINVDTSAPQKSKKAIEADAILDNEEKAEGEDAAARDKYKQFGLRVELTYSDNNKEYHYVPLHPDVKE